MVRGGCGGGRNAWSLFLVKRPWRPTAPSLDFPYPETYRASNRVPGRSLWHMWVKKKFLTLHVVGSMMEP